MPVSSDWLPYFYRKNMYCSTPGFARHMTTQCLGLQSDMQGFAVGHSFLDPFYSVLCTCTDYALYTDIKLQYADIQGRKSAG